MYLEYYGLEQAPFSITPDPHYVFLSEHHRDALAHLLYGIRQGGGGGFVQLTGEVGTGKTTLSRLLLNQLPEGTQAALVLNPRLDPIELMETICEELGLRPGGASSVAVAASETAAAAPEETASKQNDTVGKAASKAAGKRKKPAPAKARAPSRASPRRAKPTAKALYDLLSAHLLQAYARGERVVLIVDEAQNLSTEALEQIRLLTNLETETQKLLQIILIGQPELREMLMRPELRQLAQRITARYHLPPLDEAGTDAYLRHRLTTAGARRFPFSADAVRRVHRRSGGVPRLINVIAERALLAGFAHDLLTLDGRTVDRAADEALAPTAADVMPSRGVWLRFAGLALAIVAFVLVLMRWPASDASTDTAIDAAANASSGHEGNAAPANSQSPHPASRSLPSTTAAATAARDDGGAEALQSALRAAASKPTREWSPLLAAWSAPATLRATSPDACPPAPAPGWRCLRSRASLDQLLRIDRSVLLRLRAEPHAAWARLLGANADRVRLSLDGRTLDVDRVALSSVWNGEFLAIWPSPERIETRYAAREPAAVDWVRARLPDDARSGDLDAGLRAFQTRHGWPGDGALRAETLFALAAQRTGARLSILPSSVAE
ncbi:MAG: hypothetical protein E6Q50_05705 [Lysobacter sp.]|nr:MAG: hypothetical protein E6Q50_05705 [Lysobacter sp.]